MTAALQDLLTSVHTLSRAEKLQLIQAVARDLADEDVRSLIPPNQMYEIWSPYDQFEAAEVLMKLLADEKRQP